MVSRRFFSASQVLGSRPGSVGIGVSGCSGAAWVFSRRAPRAAWSLVLALPLSWGGVVPASLSHLPRVFPGVSYALRRHHGRVFVRVRGPAVLLRAVAVWWSCSFYGRGPGSASAWGRGS